MTFQAPAFCTFSPRLYYIDSSPIHDVFPILPPQPDTGSSDQGSEDQLYMDMFGRIGSMLLVHEMTQPVRPMAVDNANYWDGILNLDDDHALENADTYKYLAIADQLLRQGYKLDPEDPSSGNLVYDSAVEASDTDDMSSSANVEVSRTNSSATTGAIQMDPEISFPVSNSSARIKRGVKRRPASLSAMEFEAREQK